MLEITGLYRKFPSGDDSVTVLSNINLRIDAGEMVALVGASGSGKSTLMNILGCLDRPTEGSYKVAGRETGKMLPDTLAQLRREYFGFIFQRYHLLPDLDAVANVEIPAIYAGKDRTARRQRAYALLAQLGLGERSHHRPSQLSGGQQQRVSIARSLMNGGEVILADEPTGALDRHSGAEVIKILQALHAEGHTVIIVTHDMHVAQHAQRIIEISDGVIISDRPSGGASEVPPQLSAGINHDLPATPKPRQRPEVLHNIASWRASKDMLTEAFKMAVLSMVTHRLRSFLTMLGIIIGIASVVSVVALGQGSQVKIIEDISAIGTNTITIYPGDESGDEKAALVRTLVPADADALANQVYVDSATPVVTYNSHARYKNISASAIISGVGPQFFRVHDMQMAEGMAFNAASVQHHLQEVVIDHNTRKKFFKAQDDPIGQVIMLSNVPVRVIGVSKEKKSRWIAGDRLQFWLPYTTVIARITGAPNLQSIIVRIGDAVPSATAEDSIAKLMTQRHGVKDFYLFNFDSIKDSIERTTATMTLLVSLIALIALVVGGIGVMNIMLVSVTERTQEIGVRMAVGARQADILRQFLLEAILVCLSGGLLGVLLALGFGVVFKMVMGGEGSFQMLYSTGSIVAAFSCSTLIGVIFGFLPARNAARLNPIDALARE
ncbi:MacB family efflux pump subunit [Glaciimonas immobilis]|nr:MacB family efflux pump subunit [Glaciimonas immobilis]